MRGYQLAPLFDRRDKKGHNRAKGDICASKTKSLVE
jgi:hypothetical protein